MREELEKSVACLSESLGKFLAAIEPALRAENPRPATVATASEKSPRSVICGQLEDLDLTISDLTCQLNSAIERLDLP